MSNPTLTAFFSGRIIIAAVGDKTFMASIKPDGIVLTTHQFGNKIGVKTLVGSPLSLLQQFAPLNAWRIA